MQLNTKTVSILGLWVLALLALLGLIWVRVIEPRITRDVSEQLGQGDYTLVAADGTTFTEDTLVGEPTAVFFGFTHCPDVCPTTMGDIATWQETLAEEGAEPIRTFFVTVDPERDTPELLEDYVSWAPSVTGFSGDPDEVQKAIKAFRIFASKVPLEDGDYTMNHSASVLLFDDKGQYFGVVGYQEDYDRVMERLRKLQAS
ncbi:SCO family protein [Pseudooceanicola sp. HF7]|uniref:SCO family protein n=1 Tax=Pseudooceanicola sp. HF7 TaxID=2721560 RepID=UPI0014317480|nr:SCO family protein [Pseudooceanicola sp. HF7]NIZ09122.1 SCO family protein [Pseudooceanicola sp. HF7]